MIILRVSLGISSDAPTYGGVTTDNMRLPSRPGGDLTVNVSRLVEVNRYTSGPMGGGSVKRTLTQDTDSHMDV
jgi:hypothetical protein